MKIAVADVETTGLDPETDRVVEYAHVVVEYLHDVSTAQSTLLEGGYASVLVDPLRDVPPESSAVHHLTLDLIRSRGAYPLPETMLMLTPSIETVSYLCFHNGAFDLSMKDGTGAALRERLPQVAVLDTWRVAAHLWPNFPSCGLQALRYRLGLAPIFHSDPFGRGAHSAGYDASTCAALLRYMIDNYGLQEVVRLSDPNKPILQWTVRKTKQYGRPWSDMDAGFCRWVLNPPGDPFDADTRYAAQYQLDWLRAGKPEPWGKELPQ